MNVAWRPRRGGAAVLLVNADEAIVLLRGAEARSVTQSIPCSSCGGATERFEARGG